MPFSNSFTSRQNKSISAVHPPGFHNGSAVDLDWRSPHNNETTLSSQVPFMQVHSGFGSAAHNSTSKSQENVQQYLQGYQSSPSSDNKCRSSFTSYNPAPISSEPSRYYSHALSKEDRIALAQGELNHNLRLYAPEDMAKHHESRKSLVPQGIGASKLRKMEAFAKIEEENQYSQRALDQKASQSLYDLRSSSRPVLRHPTRVPASPPVLTLRRKYSWETAQVPLSPYQNARTAGGTDNFSYHLGAEVLPNTTSRTSSRMPSPLSDTDAAQQHNLKTTFDIFLAPHKSGKGEAYRGASNAKKEADAKDDVGKQVKEKALRSITRIRSTSALR